MKVIQKILPPSPPRLLGFGSRQQTLSSPGSSSGGASLLLKKRLTPTFLVLLAALVAGLLFLLPGGLLQAQDSTTIKYAENGMDPVGTFTATDPEEAPITWTVLASDDGPISIDVDGDETPDIVSDDAVDAAHFMIEGGVLSFATSPDFENPRGAVFATGSNENTYRVVVVASDAMVGGMRGYEKVTVEVTNEDEEGTVTWTVDAGSGETNPTVVQFQIGAVLTASVRDGDEMTGNVRSDTGWRWYSSSSRTSPGTTPLTTSVSGTLDNIYTVQRSDVGNYIHVQGFYYVGTGLQETDTLASDYPVLDTAPTGSEPDFDPDTDPDTVTRMVNEGDAGMTVGAPVTATGGHGVVNYGLTGAGVDNAKFEIDQKSGQITTKWDLDREGTAEAAADAVGRCQDTGGTVCMVTVTATDSAGATATATVTINLENVDDKPTFTDTGNQPTITVEENSTELDVTYAAADPEGGLVALSLTGADGALFRLNSDDVLSFRTAPDYENPTDMNNDNVYEVTVQASDGTMYADRMVRVTVTPVDEGPEIAELDGTIMYAETGMDPVVTLMAMDPEDDTITWSRSGGADQAVFDTNVSDGVLKFISPPDYENAQDSGSTNTYEVEVEATDGMTPATITVTVEVTNEDEEGTVTWTVDAGSGETNPTVVQFQIGAVLAASVSDGDVDGPVKTVTAENQNLRWQWFSSSSRTSPGTTPIPGEDDAGYTVQPSDLGKYIHVRAIYSEGVSEPRLLLASDYPVLDTAPTGSEPDFDPDTVTRMVNEGDAGMTVGAPVTATGGHGVVNYGLTGAGVDNAKFEIDQKSGQITTKWDLDREGTAEAAADAVGRCQDMGGTVCTVTVTATDSAGATATATVTINLENVDDKPTFGDVDTTPTLPNNLMRAEVAEDATVTDLKLSGYTATDPEMDRVNLTLMGADKDLFRLGAGTGLVLGVLSLRSTPDYENPMDMNNDNVYEVTVRATDTTMMYTDRMVRVTVTKVDEAPMIMRGGLAVSGPSIPSYAENGMDAVGAYTATGPDAASARWTLEGDDAMYFSVGTRRGAMTELMFRSAPDYEMPRRMAMSDANTNTYMVTVKANDGIYMDTHDVMVMVTNVEEIGTLSGPETVSDYMENGTYVVGTYTVSGGSMSEMANLTLMGDDAGDFRIMDDGMLRFRSMPNYEMPMDADRDNTYMVTVKAEVGGEMTTHPVTVMVINVDEDGMVVTLSTMSPRVGAIVTATLNDPDGMVSGETWQWSKSMDMAGTFIPIDGAMETSYSPTSGDVGSYLRVTVSYTDALGNQTAEATTTSMVVALVISGMSSVSYAENGMDAVATYTASGPDAASAAWSVSGDDAGVFDISAGVLTFKTSPDYEAPASADMDNVYMVTVNANDGTNMDELNVMVTVTDVMDDTGVDDPLLAEYDPDGDGTIEKMDMRRAVADFFGPSQTLSRADMRRLVSIYFSP